MERTESKLSKFSEFCLWILSTRSLEVKIVQKIT